MKKTSGKKRIYGYIRVSSQDQNEARQMVALQESSYSFDEIFLDKQSGKDFDRPRYQALMRKLRAGDLIIIKSIDRLGRNYEEIMQQWQKITKEKGVDIIVLDMPLLDTTRDKDLLGTFISDLVLQVLSFVSQNERENIRQRQAEGIAAAKEKGIRFGRPVTNEENLERAVILYLHREITIEEAVKISNLSRSSFYRRKRKWLDENREAAGTGI